MNDQNDIVKIEEIKKVLPHRYPFLLIDLVKDIIKNESATGLKNVTINEPFFQGHFPKKPIMPGVLVIEAMAQTAGMLVAKSLDKVNPNILVYFMTIEKAKFRKLVEPGDQLLLRIKVIRKGKKIWKFSGEAIVNEILVSEAEFSAMMIEPDSGEKDG